MNRKAQALVEFVLILPVLIMLIFAFIDIGRIYAEKSKLESVATSVVEYIKSDEENKDVRAYLNRIAPPTPMEGSISLNIESDGDKYSKIKLSKSLALITPGFNLILGNNYKVECERVIINEE